MNEGHFIGLNDETDCGGKVLEGDTRVMLYGLAHALEGDRVTCGKDGKTYELKGGISHMISHGRRMAGTLDTYSGCPCKARLIPSVFTATYQTESNFGPGTNRVANLSGALTGNGFPTSSLAVDPRLAANVTFPLGDLVGSGVCHHPDQMEELAAYIAGEMNRNIRHPSVLRMKALINYDSDAAAKQFRELPWYAKLAGSPNFNAIAWTKKLEAMAIWTKQVGQNMEWDHKPKLQAMYNDVFWHKQGRYDYYYDIWSNIHYGYVGIASGLSESVLLDGAGAEQIASDTLRKVEESLTKPIEERSRLGPRPTASPWTELRSWDDVADRVSIIIGTKLALQYPKGGVTAQIIMKEVLAIAPESWGDGIRVHPC